MVLKQWAKAAGIRAVFENDVKMYGTQAVRRLQESTAGLRMM